ncbi:MAG: YugN family protein [Caryophanon sp.]|nr:YugN family protein [Caryophanon sp.]
MYLNHHQLDGVIAEQELLEKVMAQQGLECTGAWDYDRKTFDRRFDLQEGRYYLRVFTYAIEGDVGAHNAVLKIVKPALGKYYYPHGVEYTDEVFPTHLVEACERILQNVEQALKEHGRAVTFPHAAEETV